MLSFIGRFVFFVSVFFGISGFGQSVAVGNWRDHYPYRLATKVAIMPDKVFCGTENALFSYSKIDGSMDRLNTSNGLSSTGVTALSYHAGTQSLFIGYRDADIDIIRNGEIINVGDIKRSTFIPGAKTIYNVDFRGDLAYISCSFGIVVLDMRQLLIIRTFYPGNGNFVDVFDVAFEGNDIYAASSIGLLRASLNDPTIVFFQGWSPLTGFPILRYQSVTFRDNRLFASAKAIIATDPDTLFERQDNFAQVLLTDIFVNDLDFHGNRLMITTNNNITYYHLNTGVVDYIFNYFSGIDPAPRHCVVDASSPELVWIADGQQGLVRVENYFTTSIFYPDGPYSSDAFTMASHRNRVWVGAGRFDDSYTEQFSRNGVAFFEDNEWKNAREIQNETWFLFSDVVRLYIDPSHPSKGYAGSWGFGLAEVENGEIKQIYNASNSQLSPVSGDPQRVRVGGITRDKEGILWVSTSNTNRPVSSLSASGQWQNYGFSGVSVTLASHILCDSSNNKWVILPGNGLLAFRSEGTQIAQSVLLRNQPGMGNLNTNQVRCLAQDLDGTLWVGTSQGVCVFYSPDQVFNPQAPPSLREAQKIIIKTTGFNQYLLESEDVTCMLVDGANRKWFGTANSGIFLVSPDGTEQIAAFSAANSPLPSNSILSLGMNYETGELLVGTDRGVMGYRGTATLAEPTYSNVSVFPNPVKPDYSGIISIRGLVRDADVHITDAAGNLVYRTKAQGGQANWHGRRNDGSRPSSGVYLVFCSDGDGSRTFVTKFLLIN